MNILYEDSALVLVNKPAGLATVPGGWESEEASLVKELEAQYGRIWVVHRLDKGTSGLVVFARNAEAHRSLSMAFEHHRAQKVYHAIVNGSPGWDEHIARHPLRVNVGHSHRTVVDNAKGKPSQTSLRVLERFKNQTLLEARPASGRTHQVRVHACALGLPLLGDTLYGAPATELIKRPALHAFALAFELDGKAFAFEAPYPEDLAGALKRLSTTITH